MARKSLGVVAGLICWVAVWIGCEIVLAAIWPKWFGNQLLAFQNAIESGNAFTPDTRFLITQIAYGIFVSTIAGFLAATIARERNRTPVVLAVLLSLLGMLKMYYSWEYIPIWFHLVFAAILILMPVLGGKFGLRRLEEVHNN